MTLENLGNIGEFVGAIAVVVSLLYLAVQIRHSSRIARFDAHRNLSEAIASVLGDIARSPELYTAWKNMTESPEDASHDDRERFGMLLHQFFTTFADAHRFKDTDPHLALRYREFLRQFMGMSAVRGWWSRRGPLYSAEFRAFVDTICAEVEADASSSDAQSP